eukprot:TRINITY_DN2138_c0_g1_i1.p1 TRINITY_DN2138_c0_g1~~TRINITY_DN2138_c0_g1_i1.p1  ORF type:complete len:329 (+),score=37.66 TRINITY_DN2138_c0_g1_i1:43-1029(+)
MKPINFLFIAATIALCAFAAEGMIAAKDKAIDLDLIDAINAKEGVTWTAGVNANFDGWTNAEVMRLLGSKRRDEMLKAPKLRIESPQALPTNFTSATNWPACRTIRTIYNQARCGSCWAFGGIEAISDRFCIASKGSFNQALSFAQITECSDDANGCEGGSAEATYDFVQYNGAVTDSCYPYYIPTCPPAQQPCLNFVDTPECWSNRSCVDGKPWQSYRLSSYYGYNSNQDAQQDMFVNGPVEACFDVYADFLNYKSGVYQHTSGDFLGGHCIKIQGWGVENGTPYWLVNNSWTTSWGDNGQFKILRGQDECGIEDGITGGTPIWPPA